MASITSHYSTGERPGGESASAVHPTPPGTDVNKGNNPAPAKDDSSTDTATDMENEDPGMPAGDLCLLPPDSRRLVDRLQAAVGYLRSGQAPFRHMLTLSLVALVLIQVVILSLRTQEEVQTERVKVSAVSETRMRPLVCQRPGCVLQAAETITFINRSVDPCENFFQYACGRFKEVYPSPAGDPLDIATILRQRTRDRVLQLLQEEQYYNSSSAISKARLFFSTCMRAYQLSLNNVPDLVEMLREFGGLDLFGTWYPVSWNFNDILINASAVHLLDAFFKTVTWQQDLGVINLHVPAKLDISLSISARLRGPSQQRVTNRTRHLIREVLRQLEQDTMNQIPPPLRECNDTCVDEMAGDIIAVQEELLAITPRRRFFALTAGPTSTRVSMSELKLLVPQVDWRRLLDAMFGVNIIHDPVVFMVPSRAYMAGVGRIIDNTRVKRLHHFLMWSVIRRYLMALGPVYSTLGEELDLSIPNREVVETREEMCSKLLTIHMEPVLHGLLLASHIGEESVSHAQDFFKNVFRVLGESFGWMTEASQRQSQKLLDNIKVDFALGSLKESLIDLDKYYAPLHFRKLKFFDNMRNLYGFNKPGKITGWLKVKRRLGDLGITYDPVSGKLTVPFTALQIPWYHSEVPDHLNAAALGSLVYHTLADGFILSPLSPRLTHIWDQETMRRFNNFTHCLETASQNSSVPAIESVLTLFMPQRNTSRSLSTKTVIAINYFFAYHVSYRLFERLKNQGQGAVLPGMQHTSPEQAFYLTFAHTRCTNGLPLFFIPPHISGKTMVAVMPKDPDIINHLILSDPGFRKAHQCKGPAAAEHTMGLCSLF